MSDPALATLAPPATTSGLTLTAPEPVAGVAPAKAGGMVPLDPAALPGLDHKVDEYVASVVALDPNSPEFNLKAKDIASLGDDDIRAAADSSNRLLQSPLRAMTKGGFAEGSQVSATLLELRRTVEDLDPSTHLSSHKLLSHLPFGNKLRDYFGRFESAQHHLDAIVKALYDGKDELLKDNAALEQEKVHLWETMQRLAQYIYIAERLDKALDSKIAEIEAADPDRAKALREDVLFYARQKHQDLLTQLAVSIQGYLAIDLVHKNNQELIRGVDRATTTTIAALRTAVVVAQALTNQKLVLDQITALNTTTSNLIESTSQLLATQGVAIQQQAASAAVGIDKLQAAFANVYQAMDAVDTFKTQALASMQVTVTTLQAEIEKSQTYLARVRDSDARQAGGPLNPGSPGTGA